MEKQKGFTVIELIIAIAIITCLVLIFVTTTNNGFTIGINGINQQQCIAGYVHNSVQEGSTRQVLDEHGRGIPCK